MSPVCVIQHVSCESPGLIADVLKAEGLTLAIVRPYRRQRVPHSVSPYAGLVVLGGPMSVYEQDRHPFLRQERRLIEQALAAKVPVLGVCLGSQLLAAALGSVVTRGLQKEIGWHPVTLTQPAANDRLWKGLGPSLVAYHWHGDVFELPRGAVALAWSQWTDCQAFRHGRAAYGFLFHLEVTPPIIRRMTQKFRDELLAAGVKGSEIIEGMKQHLEPLRGIGRTVFQRWARLVKGGNGPVSAPLLLRTKRVQQAPAAPDGARFLVDRLWPRGVKKETLRLDGWLRDVAPSDALRRWFGHAPERWPEFRRRYFAELDRRADALQPILAAAARGPVTLLFAARDPERNNAVALRDYLTARQADGQRRGRARAPETET
jgi:GMP synthase (glutamine-hydrolysing)